MSINFNDINDPTTMAIIHSIEESQRRFEERTRDKHIPNARYTYGDKLLFDGKIGVVEVVDRYGTFEQNEEPSYDLWVKSENMFYKHIRQSWISHKVGVATPEERLR